LTSDRTHNNQLAKVVGYSFPVILTVLFLLFAFKGIDLNASFHLITHSSFTAIILYVIVFFLSHYIRAIRWNLMLESVKKDASLGHLFGSVIVGYGVNCVIPRLGEVYRGLFLGRWERISRTTVIGTVVVERMIDMFSFAFAALISVSIYSGDLYNEIVWLKTSLVIGFAMIFLVTIFLIFIVRFKEKFRDKLVRFVARFSEKYAERLKSIIDTLIYGLASIKSKKNMAMVFFWSVVMMIVYAINAQIGFYVLGIDFSGNVTFEMAWIVMTISSFSAMIPTPGGVGSYHAISILVLTQLYKFDKEFSAAYAILTNFISIAVFVISTVVIVYYINHQRQKSGLTKETFLSVFKIDPDEK
jgi:glycosyltransferase 2 family protein